MRDYLADAEEATRKLLARKLKVSEEVIAQDLTVAGGILTKEYKKRILQLKKSEQALAFYYTIMYSLFNDITEKFLIPSTEVTDKEVVLPLVDIMGSCKSVTTDSELDRIFDAMKVGECFSFQVDGDHSYKLIVFAKGESDDDDGEIVSVSFFSNIPDRNYLSEECTPTSIAFRKGEALIDNEERLRNWFTFRHILWNYGLDKIVECIERYKAGPTYTTKQVKSDGKSNCKTHTAKTTKSAEDKIVITTLDQYLNRVVYEREKSDYKGGHHKSPIEHTVRGHYRRYKSGVTVWINSHTRGGDKDENSINTGKVTKIIKL